MKSTLLALLVLCSARSDAQVAPSGTWRTLHTAHFRVHFRPEYRAVAGEAAREAERAYTLLASELHPPRGVVDLTLADDVDASNGFASVYPSNRITLFLPPPVADPGLQTYDSWLRLVIVHELAHIFHLDRARGFWAMLQSAFGRAPGLFPNEYQPSWVIEGLATYYESRYTAAGRADGTFHRQVVAADAAAGTARSPWDALFFTRWPAGLAPYAYGSRFFDHLSAAAGDTVVPRFVEGAARQLIPYRVGRPLRRAGAPRALSDDWARAIALATPADSASAAPSRRLIGGLRSAPVPRLSADGRRLAYLYDDGRGARQLRVVDATTEGEEGATGRPLRSHRVTGQVTYDWRGDTLIVAQLNFTDRWHIRSDLWRWEPDGAWRRVTRGARRIEPRSGGGILASLALRPGDDVPVLPPPGVADPPGTTWGSVVPSPDGQWLAALRHREGHWALVRWRAAAPESVSALVEAPGLSDPSWTPDEGLLYVADVAGFPQVHRWDAGAGARQVSAEPLGARAPALRADGTLLFTTLARDGWELRAAGPVERRTVPIPAPREAFASAPPVPVRETAYAEFPSLRPRFWLPIGWDAGVAGTFFGGVTAGIDAVGRYAYLIAATVSTAPLRAQGGVALRTTVLGNPTLDAFGSNDWSEIGSSGGRILLADDLDAGVGATFVTQRWRGFASLRLAAEYEGTRFAVAPDTTVTAVCFLCRPEDFVGGSVSAAFGHAVSAPLAVSPQDGFVASVLYRRREEQASGRWSGELRGRLALYARIPPRVGFANTVLALRLAAGTLDGSLPRRFAVGGVSSGTVSVGFGQSLGSSRVFPVRGFAIGARSGRRAATGSAELRLPLALVGRSLGHLPVGADKFALALFADAGDAWDPGGRPQLARLHSFGAEVIGDLTASYDFFLRVRAGVAQPAGLPAQLYVAFTSDF
ncbi:MAG TPA: hypothetical protein VGJ83_00780 [Gemmatimonadales bacterium]